MSLFSQSKNDRDLKVVRPGSQELPQSGVRTSSEVSTLGRGMQVTGNIICAGPLQIAGRVTGDIHASQLTITEGARVEGNIIAPEANIRGSFKGTVRGNIVKLQSSAIVEGEIFNKSLSIEQDARFEGVARRLDKAVEAPSQASDIKLTAAPAPALAG